VLGSLAAQEYSLGPFQLNEATLRKILTHKQVHPLIVDVLRGVCDETRVSEDGYGNAFYIPPNEGRRYGILCGQDFFGETFKLTNVRDILPVQIPRENCW
jgi:hypothetical protein